VEECFHAQDGRFVVLYSPIGFQAGDGNMVPARAIGSSIAGGSGIAQRQGVLEIIIIWNGQCCAGGGGDHLP
jgi:hypothetical protein